MRRFIIAVIAGLFFASMAFFAGWFFNGLSLDIAAWEGGSRLFCSAFMPIGMIFGIGMGLSYPGEL